MGAEQPDEAGSEERDDELLATAQELAGAGDEGAHTRMRRGRVRRRGRMISEDGAEVLQGPAGVRSTADEAGMAGTPPPVPEREMLDANGAVLPAEATASRPSTARAIDAGSVLAEAVRSYVDGLDARGPDDPVTADRLDRLRRTLEQYDQAT